jgi:hypothetical protein
MCGCNAFVACFLLKQSAPEATLVKSLSLALITFFVCTAASTAHAQQAGAIGVRAGVSGSPGQFYAGLHYESEPFAEQLRFRPNLEIGVGDNQTVVALNFEFAYYVPLETRRGRRGTRNPWSLYIGAGPALVIDRFTNNTNTGGGFNILIGAQHSGGFFSELKVGMIDSPGVKFGVGYTFGR